MAPLNIIKNEENRNSWDGSGIGNVEKYLEETKDQIRFYKVDGLKKVVAMYNNEIWVLEAIEGIPEAYKVDHKGQITDNFHIDLMDQIELEEYNLGLIQSTTLLKNEADQWQKNIQEDALCDLSQINSTIQEDYSNITEEVASKIAELHQELLKGEM